VAVASHSSVDNDFLEEGRWWPVQWSSSVCIGSAVLVELWFGLFGWFVGVCVVSWLRFLVVSRTSAGVRLGASVTFVEEQVCRYVGYNWCVESGRSCFWGPSVVC
jgi:hypothetical protein